MLVTVLNLAAGCLPVRPLVPVVRNVAAVAVVGARSVSDVPVVYRNITDEAGIRFTLDNGARGEHHFIETTTGGCALLDYNNDGYLDVFLIQAGQAPGSGFVIRQPCALYRNNGDGTFADVTAMAGLAFDQGYAQGVAVGDYDNDGWANIYITSYAGNHLVHNDHGRFTDVTIRSQTGDNKQGPRWATSAAWGDYDNDGHLDLIVCHYAHWSVDQDNACKNPRGARTYCSPLLYKPESPTLFHNNGDGTFADVTAKSELSPLEGRSLSVVWLDYDADGWPDAFVANDLTANFLLHNNRNGTFTNVALSSGVGVMDNGVALAGMGVAVGDYDNDGRDDLAVTNFSNQPKVVYHNRGGSMFDNATYSSGIGSTDLLMLGWGCEFTDYDLDGYKDLVVANGHVNDDVEEYSEGIRYRQPKQLFHNSGYGTFQEDGASLGDLTAATVTRGLAVGDIDNDGAPDLLANSHNSSAALFHNVGGNRNNWITLRTVGVRANRDGVGAKIWVRIGNSRQYAEVRSGSSYASHSDTRITFGLGKADKVDELRIRWPGRQEETVRGLIGRRFYVLTEGRGVALDLRMKPWRAFTAMSPQAK